MLAVVSVVFCALLTNTIAQIVPLRFEHILHRLSQYQKFSPNDIPYNQFTTEQIVEHIAFSISNNQTNQCDRDFEVILEGISKKEMWAIKVLDAWGKPLPSGVLKGNVYWVGNYDECLQPMYYPANKSFLAQPINTHYCTVAPKGAQTDPNGMPSLVLGVCLPLSCNRQSIISLVHTFFKNSNVTDNEITCSSDPPNGQKGLTIGAIVTIVVLSLLGFLVFVGTIADLYIRSRLYAVSKMPSDINGHDYTTNNVLIEPKLTSSQRYSLRELTEKVPMAIFFAEFSALRTLRRIFTMKRKEDDDSFAFINGMRVLALVWVIIGHSLLFGISYSVNILDVLAWTHDLSFQFIISAVLSVDTFFVLSGFLTAVLFVRQVRKESKLSCRLMGLYYVHRYIRLTPTFLLMILVSINLTPYFGHGPVYPSQQGFELEGCRTKYWWTSILYVGNIVKSENMCLGIAWYLHNDMQFHWLAPLSLIPFVFGRKSISFVVTILLVFVGMGSILGILLYYPSMSLNDLVAFNDVNGPNFFNDIYIKPWCRISPYAVGILTGYFVLEAGRHYRMNKYIKHLGTVLFILTALVCLFATYPDYILPSGLNRSILVAYQTLSRTLWALVIGWILFLCSTNQGGLVNKILAWRVWTPLSRLNYSCYLVHATIITISLTNQTMPFYYQRHLVVNNFVSHIFFSYVAAIVVSMFFETPFFILEKKIFKR